MLGKEDVQNIFRMYIEFWNLFCEGIHEKNDIKLYKHIY